MIEGSAEQRGRWVDFFYSERVEAWVAAIFLVIAAVGVAGSLIVSVSAVGKKPEPKSPSDE